MRDEKCKVCGEIFVPAPLHIYKDHKKQAFVCSYGCMLKSERNHKGNAVRKKKG